MNEWIIKEQLLDLNVLYHPTTKDKNGKYKPLFKYIFKCPSCGAENGLFIAPPKFCLICGRNMEG